MKKFIKALTSLFSGKNKFKDSLPAIFDEIDDKIPTLLGVATGYAVEELIKLAIEKSTGEKATEDQLKTVSDLYSPIKAAFKAFKK